MTRTEGGDATPNKKTHREWVHVDVLMKNKMKLKGNIMTKKTVLSLSGVVLVAFATIVVYAVTDIVKIPANGICAVCLQQK